MCPLGTKTPDKACGDNDETQPELVTGMPTPPSAPTKKVHSFEDADERRSNYQNVPLINIHRKKPTCVPDATTSSPVGHVPVEPTPPEPKPATESEKPMATKDREVRGSPKKCNKNVMGNIAQDEFKFMGSNDLKHKP